MKQRTITIKAIEFVDNIQEKSFLNTLLFEKTTTSAELQEQFPVGSILVSYEKEIQ